MEERIKSQLEDLLAWVDDEMSSFKREEEISKLLDQSVQAILTAVAESLPEGEDNPADKGYLGGLDLLEGVQLKGYVNGWNAYRNEVLAQLGKEER